MPPDQSHHKRRKTALAITATIGLGLVVLLALSFRAEREEKDAAAGERLRDFYDSAVDSSRSLFE